MAGDPVVEGAVAEEAEPVEKTGLRNAWGRVAATYDELSARIVVAERTR
jgi:hypothetical protein